MTQEEKKAFIHREWPRSSGTRISEMLKRYWNPVEKTSEVQKNDDDIIEFAEKLFV